MSKSNWIKFSIKSSLLHKLFQRTMFFLLFNKITRILHESWWSFFLLHNLPIDSCCVLLYQEYNGRNIIFSACILTVKLNLFFCYNQKQLLQALSHPLQKIIIFLGGQHESTFNDWLNVFGNQCLQIWQ